MESWTFLIQQEGDDVWLPLESSGSEILEGTYRVMARATQADCPLAIQVSHLELDVLPPRRRVHKRQTRTNAKGLVALLPFTLLKPGVWDILCQYPSSDPDSPWTTEVRTIQKQTLQLEVLAQEAGADLDGTEFYPKESLELVTPHHSIAIENTADSGTDKTFGVQEDDGEPKIDSDMESLLDNLSAENDPQNIAIDLLIQDLDAMDDAEENDKPINTPIQSLHDENDGNDSKEDASANDATAESTADNILQDLITELKQDPPRQAAFAIPSPGVSTKSKIAEPASTPDAKGQEEETFPENHEINSETEEMQVLMNTADQMAAHIIETMNAELHRMQTQASSTEPTDTPDPTTAFPDPTAGVPDGSTSRLDSPVENRDINPFEIIEPSQEMVVPLLKQTPSPPEQIWDEATLKRLGLTINLARDCYTVINDQLILTGMVEAQNSLHTPQFISGEQVPMPNQDAEQVAVTLDGLILGLRVRLIQPQSGDCLLEHDVALPLSNVPAPFSVLMAIPQNLNTHVLVGEVLLAMTTDPATHYSPAGMNAPKTDGATGALEGLLAQQSFTVTVELGTLLDAVQRQTQAMQADASDVELEDTDVEPLLPSPASNTTDADLATSDAIATRELQSVGYSPLPPKLIGAPPRRRRSQTGASSQKRSNRGTSTGQSGLDLPPFLQADGDRPPSPMAMAITHAMQASGALNPKNDEQSLASDSFPKETSSPDLDSNGDPQDFTPDLPLDVNFTPEVGASITDFYGDAEGADDPSNHDVGHTFAMPNEQPLSSGADTSSSADDGHQLDISATDAPLTDATGMSLTSEFSFSENPFGPLVDEDTLVDEAKTKPGIAAFTPVSEIGNTLARPKPDSGSRPQIPPDRAISPTVPESSQIATPMMDPPTAPTIAPALDNGPTVCPPLPEHIPIPTPTLVVPEEELISGMPIRIAVTLPPSVLSRGVENQQIGYSSNNPPVSLIFVKLWVQDRQTRSILDGPRWLVDFIPNAVGELESMTQLVLPIGCLEVSVEAIAVEMATQRESHKTTLHRSIMPSNMPTSLTTFDFDDLN